MRTTTPVWIEEGKVDNYLKRHFIRHADDLWRRTYWHHTTAGQPVNVAIDNANQAVNAYALIGQYLCNVDAMGREG